MRLLCWFRGSTVQHKDPVWWFFPLYIQKFVSMSVCLIYDKSSKKVDTSLQRQNKNRRWQGCMTTEGAVWCNKVWGLSGSIPAGSIQKHSWCCKLPWITPPVWWCLHVVREQQSLWAIISDPLQSSDMNPQLTLFSHMCEQFKKENSRGGKWQIGYELCKQDNGFFCFVLQPKRIRYDEGSDKRLRSMRQLCLEQNKTFYKCLL